MDRLVLPAFSAEDLKAVLGAPAHEAHSRSVSHILTDSRSLLQPEGTLFFAIRTDSGDGHRYLERLYVRGVRSFVVEVLPEESATRYGEANWYLVSDSVKALQLLAQHHLQRFPTLLTVGLTGSNGKTIVKELLYQLLGSERTVVRSPRSHNSQIGLPLSLLSITAGDELGLFEVGISQRGEMAQLAEVFSPRLGIFTTLGSAHQEGFLSLEEKLQEKLLLFAQSEALFYPLDEVLVREQIERTYGDRQRYTWSHRDPSATIYISALETSMETCRLHFRYALQDYTLTVPFTDGAYLEDVACCLTLISYLAPELLSQPTRWRELAPVSMRLEVKDGLQGNTLINDAYSCDLQSLSLALDFLRRRSSATGARPVVLLSDIAGSGLREEALYAQVAELLRSYGVAEVFAVGEAIQHLRGEAATLPVHFYPTTEALLEDDALSQLRDSCILIKGARRFALDRVYQRLSSREHQTILDIDLQAVVHNLNHYRSLLPAGHPLICMIKADGYGTGDFELARTLQEHRVDYLAVAVADEGRVLRTKGIRTHLMIMNPELRVAETLFAYHLEPEVYSFDLLRGLAERAELAGLTAFPIHLKVDSGMHRLGFTPEELTAVGEYLREHPALRASSVFSHLAAADEGDKRTFTLQQIARFEGACHDLTEALGYAPKRHILNTAGIEAFGEYAFEMARLGIGLYGVSPTGRGGLLPVARLSTVILQVRDLPAGEAVGYGCRGVTDRPSRVAVIPIGYADGFSRRLSRGAYRVLVGGVLCPTLGNVCMDACMVDVTEIADVKVGDPVVIFGEEACPLEGMATACDTIPYEILTGLSLRIQRRYWRE